MALDTDVRTLYVANLDRNVSEDLLYELFLQAGPIERVNIPNSNNDSFRYGFVTYKHESSVEYAVELFKGTCLFKKELLVKKKGERSNPDNSNQQLSNFPRYGENNCNNESVKGLLVNSGQVDFNQISQLLLISPNVSNCNLNRPNQRNDNYNQNPQKKHWSNRSKPYDRSYHNFSPRSREHRDARDKHKERDHKGKSYGQRKGRY